MSEEWTVAIIKPDAVESGWIGDILKEASRAELYPNYMLLSEVSSEVWAEFYAEHKGKTFYDGLISHMSSGPAYCSLWKDVTPFVRGGSSWEPQTHSWQFLEASGGSGA